MLMPELLKTVIRELTLREPLARTPEPSQAMEEEDAVAAYANGGRENGALSGAYLYHLAQMCRMVPPGGTVLDLGCGPGNLLGQLAELNPGARFIGADLSQPMLERAAQAFHARGIANATLQCEDMTTLAGIADQSVDLAVSSMAFHHLPDEDALDRAFAQVARVLKPQGTVYFNDFGRLRSAESIRYFVSRAAAGESRALIDDYIHSLHAAFTLQDFERVAQRHLAGRAQIYATAVSPFTVVLRSPVAMGPASVASQLKQRFRALPAARKADVRQLSLFLRLGGLPSAM